MLDLQINRQPDERGTLVFCWWIACLSDAIGSAYLRRKPLLYVKAGVRRNGTNTCFRDDDDYDTKGIADTAGFVSPADPVLSAGLGAAVSVRLYIIT